MSLHVDSAAYKASVHADVSCTDCHADIKDLPHPARLKRVDCSGCHSEVAAVYAKSRHVVAADRKLVVNGRRARIATAPRRAEADPLHLSDLLPQPRRHLRPVHANPEVTSKRNVGIPGASRMYDQGIHNIAIVEKGLNKSATCADCHGAHNMLERTAPASTINSGISRDVRKVPLRRLHHLP